MARKRSGVGAKILVGILLGLLAYNLWQVSVLRGEIGVLKTEIAVLEARDAVRSAQGSKDASTMKRAGDHIQAARERIAKRDFDGAWSELEASLQIMQKAGRNAGSSVQDALDKAGKTLEIKGDPFQQIRRYISLPKPKGG